MATSPTGKLYIGLTTKNLKTRIKGHKDSANRGIDTPFYRAIRKYGIDSFSWDIIDSAENVDELIELERSYITKFGSFGNGYNSTTGGEVNKDVSEETKLKNCLSNGGKPFLVYDLKGNLIGEWINKHQCSRELNLSGATKISQCLYGKRISHKGYTFTWKDGSEISKSELPKTYNKSFLVYKNDKFIGEWTSQKQCSIDLKLDATNINHCLKGRQKSHKGCVFKLKEDNLCQQ